MTSRETVERVVAEALEERPMPRKVEDLDDHTRRALERYAAARGVTPQEALDKSHARLDGEAEARERGRAAAAIVERVRRGY